MAGFHPIAAWRRILAPAPPSPAIERFLGWLAVTPYDWTLRADGRLRADDHGTEICAVTGVVRHREARAYSVGDWVRAGESLGLSYEITGLIVDAADGRISNAFLATLRTRLLIAARLLRSSTAPSVGQHRDRPAARPARPFEPGVHIALRSPAPRRPLGSTRTKCRSPISHFRAAGPSPRDTVGRQVLSHAR